MMKKELGCSIMNDVIHLRIGESLRLLVYTDERIADISGTIGFNDPKYFMSSFKKIVGVTPPQFRKAVKGKQDHGRTKQVRNGQ